MKNDSGSPLSKVDHITASNASKGFAPAAMAVSTTEVRSEAEKDMVGSKEGEGEREGMGTSASGVDEEGQTTEGTEGLRRKTGKRVRRTRKNPN
jgi:hypothetical protein